jgi:hypothetical protein
VECNKALITSALKNSGSIFAECRAYKAVSKSYPWAVTPRTKLRAKRLLKIRDPTHDQIDSTFIKLWQIHGISKSG